MFDSARKLNKECGIGLPEKNEQYREFCAGSYTRTVGKSRQE